MRECWVIEEQNDNGEWYIIHLFGGRGAADEELARWPSTPENPKRIVRYEPKPNALEQVLADNEYRLLVAEIAALFVERGDSLPAKDELLSALRRLLIPEVVTCVPAPPQEETAATARVQRLTDRLRETTECLHDMATERGGWAWEEVLDDNRAALAEGEDTRG